MTWREMVGDEVFRLRGENRGPMISVWWNVVLLAGSVAALPFDRRTILGLNPWVKPIKFEISVIVFALTTAVLLSGLGRMGAWPKWRRAIGWGIGISMIVENTLIALQSARGVRSHMNYTSWFNGIAFATMGVFIAVSTTLVGVLLVLFCITRTGLPRPVVWAARLGLGVLLAGSLEGALMVAPYIGHTVGAPDGGPGLPFVNWSTAHGDLRVAHFFALHAIQVFLVAGWALSRTRLGERVQTGWTLALAAIYCAGVWLIFAQAAAGRPLLPM